MFSALSSLVPRRAFSGFAAVSVALAVVVVLSDRYDDGDPSSYSFLRVGPDGATPLTYPCGPISYVVNPAGAPEDYAEVVHGAVGRVAKESGFRFSFAGETTQPLLTSDIHRLGPVLIAWTALEERIAGRAGSAWNRDADTYRTGSVRLDREWFNSDASLESRQAVVMHELGHVLGLGHVDDRHQLMYFRAGRRTDFGAGDREGLRRLHAASCGGP